jgi:hypothetical protein
VHRQPGRFARHDERAHAVHACLLGVGPDLYCEKLSHRRVRNERHGAVDHPVPARLPDGGRFTAGFLGERTVIAPPDPGIGAASSEGEVIALVLEELREKPGALRRRHQPVEQHVAQGRGVAEHDGNVHVTGGKLFHHDARREAICARAARLFGQRQGAQSHAGCLVERVHEQRLVERLQAIRVNRHGPDFALDKVAQRFAEFQLLRGEIQVVHI